MRLGATSGGTVRRRGRSVRLWAAGGVMVAAMAGVAAAWAQESAPPTSEGGATTADVAVPPPVVPRIDQGLKDRLRAVFLAGLDAGRRPGVFAKVGDSHTDSRYFLEAVGCGYVDFGPFGDLAPTVDYFRQVEVPVGKARPRCGLGNSFTRRGVSVKVGWTAAHALAPMRPELPECPAPDNNGLKCELKSLSPSVALIMFGTNETTGGDAERYYQALSEVTRQALDLKVIPVLSTIPPRVDKAVMAERVRRFNEIVVQVGAEQQVPVWNYWLALQTPDAANAGLLRDGIHLNTYRANQPASFAPDALHYGYNVRNLTALQVLDKLRRVVFEDGPAD
jgi:hypothetical protein